MVGVVPCSMIYSKRHMSKWIAKNKHILDQCGCVFDHTAYKELCQAFNVSPDTLTVLIFPERCEPTSFAALRDRDVSNMTRGRPKFCVAAGSQKLLPYNIIAF